MLSVNDLFGLACCLTKAWRFIWKTRGKSKDFLTFFSFFFPVKQNGFWIRFLKKIILQKFLSKSVHRRALDSPLAKLSSPLKTISSKQDHPKPQ